MTAWQSLLVKAFKTPQALLKFCEIDEDSVNLTLDKAFPLRVTQRFAEKITKGDIYDPLLIQVLPIIDETYKTPGYVEDPLDENTQNPLPGLLHKYHGRVLLNPISSCAIHCRYCFRRYFPYSDNNPGSKGWDAIIDYLKADSSISEVILSGADPLLLNDKSMEKLLTKLASVNSIKRLRFHSRVPIVLPERLHTPLIDILSRQRFDTSLVIHCNHPKEIDTFIIETLQRLSKAGITLLNQSVLLKGVNDNQQTLCELSEKLFSAKVLPYYLHQLDKVQGSAHFAVSLETAKQLMQKLSHQLPGYLLPKFVYEQAGIGKKVPISY